MRILKITSFILLLPVMAFYFSTCSTAEQTTAKLAFDRGDFKKAEEEFMKEVKQNPSNEEAWFYLAMSRVQLKNPEGTKEAIEKYKGLKLNSFREELVNAWGTLIQKGEKLYEEGAGFLKKNDEANGLKKYSEAVDEFQFAYIILPDSAFVKDNINIINDQINTISVKPLIDKGVEFEKQGNYEAAVSEYTKAKEKIKRGTLTYEVVVYDLSLANLKWGEQMRTANDQDTTYKNKYRDAMPYLEDLTDSKEACTQYNAYMLLVQVYANVAMSDKALDAIAKRDKLKTEHPECVPNEDGENIGGGFSFKNVSFQQNEIYIKVIGEVTSSDKSYQAATFKISLYDGNKKLLETVNFIISNISKGETKSFDALTTAKIKVSDIKSYKIQFDNGY